MYDKETCKQVRTRTSKTKFQNSVFLVLLLVMLILLAGCAKKQEKPRSKPPVPVIVAVAGQKTVPVQLRAIGNVEAYNSVAVKAQVSGIVAEVHFREGQDVRKGQLLFTLDPRPFQAALRQSEANLAKDLAQYRNAVEQARRYAALLQDGIVTQEQYDQLKTNADALDATVGADRAAVENAKIQLSYCYIRSPLDGRTGSLVVNIGNTVKANELPALVTINQVTPVYVSFTILEKELATIKSKLASGKMTVEAVVSNDGKGVEPGVISFVDNTVDMTTGTIRLKGTFVNRERRLWPGQFVNVVLTLATKPNAVVVPTAAVQTAQSGQFVFVVGPEQKAELRPVVTSITNDGFTVIEKGLKAGEVVVTDGQMSLAPGARVELKKAGEGSQQPASPATGKGASGQQPMTGQTAAPSPEKKY
jgi:multidrug efflux system membrane fusion protein